MAVTESLGEALETAYREQLGKRIMMRLVSLEQDADTLSWHDAVDTVLKITSAADGWDWEKEGLRCGESVIR